MLADSALWSAWHTLWPYLVMLAGFSAIVFVHELGHFAVAKWAGVRVERFAIGFGRELFGFTRGETRYSFNILPLGGYVKMLGQEDFDDKTLELTSKEDPRSFLNKPVGHRMAIVSAGVIMNIIFAGLLFMVVFLIGREAPAPRIAYVQPDSPAAKAGLQPGDTILQINDERIYEFSEVTLAVLLSKLHEPLDFKIRRDDQEKLISVEPEYTPPDNTRDPRRQLVGIAPGITPEITFLGPEIDPTREDHPHVGDIIVEIDGTPVTKENVNEVIGLLAYNEGDVIVERADPNRPDAPPQRVRVHIPPILQIFPTGDRGEPVISVLGLQPLIRFSYIDPRGRAYLAGLEAGDTVLAWDDIDYPSRQDIALAIQDSADRDIPFRVQKLDGEQLTGFVRPKTNSRGPATIQAVAENIEGVSKGDGTPRARFSQVRAYGQAARAGIAPGDAILSLEGVQFPSMADVNTAVREEAGRILRFVVQKADGSTHTAHVQTEPPGSVDASYNLVADDLLRIGDVVAEVDGVPTPAAKTSLAAGALITSVNDRAVSRWRELIDAFREHAGTTVKLTYQQAEGETLVTSMPVPHSPRTLLGVGPEAQIVSVDDARQVRYDTADGQSMYAIGYHKGLKEKLHQLRAEGKTVATIEFRADPLAELETKTIPIDEDMTDPWLSRIAFSANIDVAPELVLLKGENAWEALRIGIHKTHYFILQVYTMMERMIFTRSVGLENISGPLGIIDMGGKVARASFVDFLFFMAMISANLAVINFLPLPIVDGGLMVFLIIEKIKGSPVSLKVQVATQMIGLFLIIGAFLFVTFNDAMRLWG